MAFSLALCSEVYKTPIEETMRSVAALGFDGIEIAPFNVAESVDDVPASRRKHLRHLASELGLPIIGLHWLLVSPAGLHLTTPDDGMRRRTVKYLQSLAHFCADLGGTFLVLGSPRQRNLAPGDDPASARRRTAEGLRDVAEVCSERDVRLLLEPLHPAETNFLQTVEEALVQQQMLGARIGLDGAGPHLVTGPLYHAAPLLFAVYDQANGAPLVVMPRWDERAALALLAEREIAHTHLVPTMFVRLLRLPDAERAAFRAPRLSLVLHGAAPISVAVKRRMLDWWGPVLVEYWGGTEGGVNTLVAARDWLAHPGTVGAPRPPRPAR